MVVYVMGSVFVCVYARLILVLYVITACVLDGQCVSVGQYGCVCIGQSISVGRCVNMSCLCVCLLGSMCGNVSH
jgi:hypothetical protein